MKKIVQSIIVFLIICICEQSKAQSCSLTASFSYSVSVNTPAVNFSNTSVGTSSNAICNWYFGDGTSDTTMVLSAYHTYTNNGVYTVILMVIQLLNDQWCSSVAVQTVTVNACILKANFSHTLNVIGEASFVSSSTGTNVNTTYYWDFGDGNFSTEFISATHTYTNDGTHYVKLKLTNQNFSTCRDSIERAINVTLVTTDIDNNHENITFYTYPNPVDEILNVELEIKNEELEMRIVDLLGTAIKNEKLKIESGKTQISLNELKNGIYFLSVQSENKVFTKKIIVNR